jgi:hypothetical protein
VIQNAILAQTIYNVHHVIQLIHILIFTITTAMLLAQLEVTYQMGYAYLVMQTVTLAQVHQLIVYLVTQWALILIYLRILVCHYAHQV